MGSLLPGWDASAEAPTPTRRWSNTVRRQDLETLRREEQRHREARVRLSAAAAARAGAAHASSPEPPEPPGSVVASRGREDTEASGATEDLLREMRLGAWHRLLSDARRGVEPDPGDGEISVDSAVVSGVAATLADPARDFFPGEDYSATFGFPSTTRALDALALERSGGRFPRGDARDGAEPGAAGDAARRLFAPAREEKAKEKETSRRVRVRLEVVEDDEDGGKKEEGTPAGAAGADRESFVRVVEEARRRRAAAAAAAAPARPSGWWDRTESAHLNRDVSREA